MSVYLFYWHILIKIKRNKQNIYNEKFPNFRNSFSFKWITLFCCHLSEFLRWGLMSIILVVIFLDCCHHLYCGKLKHNILDAVSSGLLQVSLVYRNIEMIQPWKSFLKFDSWSNKSFKNYKDLIQIRMSFFFYVNQLMCEKQWHHHLDYIWFHFMVYQPL